MLLVGVLINIVALGLAVSVPPSPLRSPEGPDGWPPLAVYTLGICILAAIAPATARETYDVPLLDLGKNVRVAHAAA